MCKHGVNCKCFDAGTRGHWYSVLGAPEPYVHVFCVCGCHTAAADTENWMKWMGQMDQRPHTSGLQMDKLEITLLCTFLAITRLCVDMHSKGHIGTLGDLVT